MSPRARRCLPRSSDPTNVATSRPDLPPPLHPGVDPGSPPLRRRRPSRIRAPRHRIRLDPVFLTPDPPPSTAPPPDPATSRADPAAAAVSLLLRRRWPPSAAATPSLRPLLLRPRLLPLSLHQQLYRKLVTEVFDCVKAFSVDPCEGGRQCRLVLAAERPLGRDSDVFLVDHTWSFRLSDKLKQLREVPSLAERMAALMCVDLDWITEVEESDEQDRAKSGSLEHVLQVMEKKRTRIQDRRSDFAAWLELEELGIDHMLVDLDLSAKFSNLESFSFLCVFCCVHPNP